MEKLIKLKEYSLLDEELINCIENYLGFKGEDAKTISEYFKKSSSNFNCVEDLKSELINLDVKLNDDELNQIYNILYKLNKKNSISVNKKIEDPYNNYCKDNINDLKLKDESIVNNINTNKNSTSFNKLLSLKNNDKLKNNSNVNTNKNNSNIDELTIDQNDLIDNSSINKKSNTKSNINKYNEHKMNNKENRSRSRSDSYNNKKKVFDKSYDYKTLNKKHDNYNEKYYKSKYYHDLNHSTNKEKEYINNKINYYLNIEDIEINMILKGYVIKLQSGGCLIIINNSNKLEGYASIRSGRRKLDPLEDKISIGKLVKARVVLIHNNKISLEIIEVINPKTKEVLWKEQKKDNCNSNDNLNNKEEIKKINEKLNLKSNLIDLNNIKEISKIKQEKSYLNNNNINDNNYKYKENVQNRGEITGIILDTHKEELTRDQKKRLNSPDIWEEIKMKMANCLDNEIKHDIDDDNSNNYNIEQAIEVEIKDDEAPFLKGKVNKMIANFSPIKLLAKTEGSLYTSAINQSEYAKDRRSLRENKEKYVLESLNNLNNPNNNPNNNFINKSVANAVKEVAYSNSYEALEWNKEASIKKFYATSMSLDNIKKKREELPIFKLRNELLNVISKRNVLIVIGETGSGKTTQMTQYLYESGYHLKGKIGCTQPRRVAATSVAKRVSEEFGCKLGEDVGYSIRFEDCCSDKTIIKYMTDGMLLREALIDKNLSSYSVIILDEAHERTIHTDILFGLLKQTLKVRHDFKLIVTSATLDASHFSTYFDNCDIFKIPGRNFHVDVFYSKEPESDYLEASLSTIMQIHLTEPKGDILLFLTGQEEIDTACQILHDRMKKIEDDAPPLIILPVYSALPSEMQTKIFDPSPDGSRKCIIATNIAEASLTIDGIYYVVDPGFCKIKVYNPKTGIDSLVVVPISQSSAIQRAGRAGRTGPGKCYRLYTIDAFKTEMKETTVPEIQRTNLANTVLLLKAMGINDLMNFQFMDSPPVQTLVSAMMQLYYLGALDDEGLLTKLGRRMAEFPLDPQLAKLLLTSVDLKCSDEIITIISMLSVQNVFYRPREKAQLADTKRTKFYHQDGDHLTLLNVYEMWKNNKFSSAWCFDNFIQHRALKKALDIRKQLITLMERYRLDVIFSNKDNFKIRKAITSGFFHHVAKKDQIEGYKTLLDGQTVFIHPSSSLFNKSPEWVVYHELVLTSKEYMREVCSIDPKWLVDVADRYFKISDSNTLSKRKRNEKIEPLFNKYDDPDAWRLSKRRGMIK